MNFSTGTSSLLKKTTATLSTKPCLQELYQGSKRYPNFHRDFSDGFERLDKVETEDCRGSDVRNG